MSNRVRCTQCPGSFELIPPADPQYSIPKMKEPSDSDYIKLFYECDEEGDRNTIWWIRPAPPVIVGGTFKSDLTDRYRDIYGTIV